jgi:hypothetical protein
MGENIVMKTAELTGAALAYWFHKAEGSLAELGEDATLENWMALAENCGGDGPLPVDWATCGPIIERDHIAIIPSEQVGRNQAPLVWSAIVGIQPPFIDMGLPASGAEGSTGPTPLIAAMRAKVASVYGEEVPDEAQP